jgi:hypothetical protein
LTTRPPQHSRGPTRANRSSRASSQPGGVDRCACPCRGKSSLPPVTRSPDDSSEQADTEAYQSSTYRHGTPDNHTTKREAGQRRDEDLLGTAHFPPLVVSFGNRLPPRSQQHCGARVAAPGSVGGILARPTNKRPWPWLVAAVIRLSRSSPCGPARPRWPKPSGSPSWPSWCKPVGAELAIHGGDLRHHWTVVVGHDRRSWRYDCSI